MSMGSPTTHQGNADTMDMSRMMGGDSLDDIIMQNNKELQRRQSQPQSTYSNQEIDRRASMVEFGGNNGNLNGFQFGPPSTMPADPNLRRQSAGEIDMNGYTDMSSGMNMVGQHMGYSSAIQNSPLAIDTSGPFQSMCHEMVQGMMGYVPMGMEGISGGDNGMSMFSPTNFVQPYGAGNMDSMQNDFSMGRDNSGMHSDENGNEMSIMSGLSIPESSMVNSPQSMVMNQSMVSYHSPIADSMPAPTPTQDPSYSMVALPPATEPEIGPVVKPEPKNKYAGIYSSSGFDMLGALMKVATRQNPEVEIGKVDMSCAFVICDLTMHDCPIIYVSDIFERLTGYSKYEIRGQNCRFLQSPFGKIEAGAERKHTDNNAVYFIRERLMAKKEVQQSLINYRKGGQPFMNLLTMIPITGEDDKEIRYVVGFQVDLVAQPASVEGKGGSGVYTVNYKQGKLPKYVWHPPVGPRPDGGQTVSHDDVSQVLSTINSSTESELTKGIWDKVLLENTDDVVHVLSLKGLFLYLSPSSRTVLEYDASELVGTALSSVCHPSDIVPVTRELKDTSAGTSVNVVFRIRRKNSGYTWFESHGSLCIEQGKGRKCIILVGRERPVYALSRRDIEAAGGIGESEVWTKLSTSGMFLFVSSNIRTLLDQSPEDLVGTSIQSLMRSESKVEFGRSLEKARTGKRVTHKHELLNRRGLVLQAQTTLYPGDASEGQKPTFLVAQTRLLKNASRSVVPALGHHGSKSKSMSSGSKQADPKPDESMPLSHPSTMSSGLNQGSPTSQTNQDQVLGPITHAGSSGLAIGSQDLALASEDNIFEELKTTRCTSWQYELRQMEKSNRLLAEELVALLANKKKRKRRKGAGHLQRDCANCHTRVTPEWRRGPSGQRDLCNSCGLRWAKQVSRSNSDPSSSAGQTVKGCSQSDSSTSRS
jgi:PAS domain-containing protein